MKEPLFALSGGIQVPAGYQRFLLAALDGGAAPGGAGWQDRRMAESCPEAWRRIIVGAGKSWVVFAQGTCVVLPNPDPATDLAAAATALLREYGPVHVGSPAGDFDVVTLDPGPGWAVTCHHPDILTYVAPDEVPGGEDLVVGLHGRGKRDQDAHELKVLHVEDAR